MNREERFNKRIEKRFGRRRENLFGGILLLAIGGILLARQVGADIPDWLLTWEMLLIIVGLFVGAKTNFRDFGWLIMIGIGLFFLVDDIYNIPMRNFIWPAIIIGAGMVVLLRGFGMRVFGKSNHMVDDATLLPADANSRDMGVQGTSDDIMEVISIFGSAKRIVLSKNFKGGEVISVFGGSEINMINADFTGRLTIEVVQVFGGTKLIIPPHWEVHSRTAAIFGGVEDKRPTQPTGNSEKVLVLEGTNVFGGIVITSY